MDKSIKMLLGVFLVLVFSGIVYAASDKAEEVKATTTAAPELTSETPKNMTYGTCVSELTKAKNSCYDGSKNTLSQCKTDAVDDAKKVKDCKATYKKDKKQCKTEFKTSKVGCKQYKKTFGDKVKFWQ